jgi:hypothetical protein
MGYDIPTMARVMKNLDALTTAISASPRKADQ